MSGVVSYLAGLSAEDCVAETYRRAGYAPLVRRWRGPGGEIDLVFEKRGALVFVEVKKSRDFATAAARLSERQMQRIYASASGFLASMPLGQDTEARFDVALVNAEGRVRILENAFGM
ncbi:MAG: YraN family protein [Rhodobacter sp.]|nr:YraN family protein [Rhodobacter sp.]